jgi:hypothetical protein
MKPIKGSVIFFILFVLSSYAGFAQVVYENPNNPVYKYLSRQAQKGNIEYNDLIQPISRREIAAYLTTLQAMQESLSSREQKELAFYQQEFSEFNEDFADTTTFFKKDQYNRWRFLSVKTKDFFLRGDPALTFETYQGGGKNVFRTATGLTFWGHAGKHIGYQFYFQDITDKGDGIDSLHRFTPETGIIRTANIKYGAKTVNYSNFRGSISYSWKNGSVSVGQDQMTWGYGQMGKVVLSDKAPAYPQIRFDYQPLKWLRFNYMYAFLNSAVIDSARTYNKGNDLFGTDREVYASKYFVSHTLTFLPTKGLTLSVGESMIMSDSFEAGYLIPIMFFKAYDQYHSRYRLSTGSNGQFFFNVSSRNFIPKTHLYASLFIDEIRTGSIFNKEKSRNQLGYTIGATRTDVGLQYLTLGAEYTRINPYVYNNLIPAQTYTNQSYLLGDWMGQNADRIVAWATYNPIPRLTTTVQFNYIRKGADGDLFDQYWAGPQAKLLEEGPVETQKQFLIQANYELIHKLYLKTSYQHQTGVIRPLEQTNAVPNEFRLAVSFGF